jgi:hypothetical protein
MNLPIGNKRRRRRRRRRTTAKLIRNARTVLTVATFVAEVMTEVQRLTDAQAARPVDRGGPPRPARARTEPTGRRPGGLVVPRTFPEEDSARPVQAAARKQPAAKRRPTGKAAATKPAPQKRTTKRGSTAGAAAKPVSARRAPAKRAPVR